MIYQEKTGRCAKFDSIIGHFKHRSYYISSNIKACPDTGSKTP